MTSTCSKSPPHLYTFPRLRPLSNDERKQAGDPALGTDVNARHRDVGGAGGRNPAGWLLVRRDSRYCTDRTLRDEEECHSYKPQLSVDIYIYHSEGDMQATVIILFSSREEVCI
jgi:hypothetical protein